MASYYMMQGREVVPTEDVHEWANWYKSADRQIARTQVGDADVSTVFLGLDHDFTGYSAALPAMVAELEASVARG